MSDNVIELTVKNFDSNIKKGIWLIDFWASWCGPCKIMAPHFEAAAKELKGKVNFGKINIEENYDLAERFNVRSIPTTILFGEGETVQVSVGALNKEAILEMIENSM